MRWKSIGPSLSTLLFTLSFSGALLLAFARPPRRSVEEGPADRVPLEQTGR
jgi:hypothetical protein